jgi:hypothetical protein
MTESNTWILEKAPRSDEQIPANRNKARSFESLFVHYRAITVLASLARILNRKETEWS